MPEHVAIDPAVCGAGRLAQILDQAIAPRPLALVSTLGSAGRPHLHPISWYSSAAVNPPVQYFAVTEQDGARGELLLEQVRRHREFVLNAVDEELAGGLAALAAAPDDADGDFLASGLGPAPSVKVAPYRVVESPAQMECRVLDVLALADGASHLVLGAVVQFHVRDDLHENGRIDQRSYRPVGKLMDDVHCRCRELYRMRPGDTA
jgi:flavin reductase (DIM6/NTAB) family NADH-FMN oxidoreductase RutF